MSPSPSSGIAQKTVPPWFGRRNMDNSKEWDLFFKCIYLLSFKNPIHYRKNERERKIISHLPTPIRQSVLTPYLLFQTFSRHVYINTGLYPRYCFVTHFFSLYIKTSCHVINTYNYIHISFKISMYIIHCWHLMIYLISCYCWTFQVVSNKWCSTEHSCPFIFVQWSDYFLRIFFKTWKCWFKNYTHVLRIFALQKVCIISHLTSGRRRGPLSILPNKHWKL